MKRRSTSSTGSGTGIARVRRPVALLFLALPLSASLGAAAGISREEALQAAYPGARFIAERVFLTAEQQEQAARLSGVRIPSALIARYRAIQDDREVGRAYVDTHVVRTKKESLLVCLDSEGKVRRIEVTAFLEPPDYQPPDAWYRQYQGRGLDDNLNLNRAIRPMAGATLSAAAANEAARRVLAIDHVLASAASRDGAGSAKR